MNYECLICQIKALPKRLELFNIPEEKRNVLVTEFIREIADIDLDKSYSPEVTRNLLEKLKQHSGISDPFEKEKEESIRELMAHYDEFKNRIAESGDPFDTALRLAIAGNIIDFGPTHNFDVWGTIDKVLHSQFAVNDSTKLRTEIAKAQTILYLGDNCGENVLDKLFLETLNHPNVYFAVRDQPVLNDATLKEASEIGLPGIATLISNGDDTPSTLLHRVSPDFKKIYDSADLIISKGMGNYEGLMDESDPRLFFLLMIKCPMIGRKIGAPEGSFVVKRCVNI